MAGAAGGRAGASAAARGSSAAANGSSAGRKGLVGGREGVVGGREGAVGGRSRRCRPTLCIILITSPMIPTELMEKPLMHRRPLLLLLAAALVPAALAGCGGP